MKANHRGIKEYFFDSTVSLSDRSFVLYSCLILVALFAAVPLGMVMREPLSATVSTFIGAVAFSAYIYYVFRRNRIAQAKVVLSVVVVVFFLPIMFFTNGGAQGGAPLWLLLGTIYIGLILEGRMRVVMLIVNGIMLALCWILGYEYPELVTEYTRGHSIRVAEYSKKIAEYYGKSPAECEEIYQIALLHDVGKIGIAEDIINKKGRLTEEEYDAIKQHPVLGAQILESVNEYPDLIIGARHHHERYDGGGYPDRLKGEEIPEIARIISVADAYDAMTSKRSYREPFTQEKVRDEIAGGAGTQFDPRFAEIMEHLIDLDTEYEMKEKDIDPEMEGKDPYDA